MAKFLDDNGLLYLWSKMKATFAEPSDIPTAVSDLTNDSGFQTSTQVASSISTALSNSGFQTSTDVDNAISDALSEITGISFEIVASLPQTGEVGTIYLLSNSGSSTNIYDEYIYVNNGWEKIGTTDVDLTGYYNTTNLVTITNAEIDTIVAS